MEDDNFGSSRDSSSIRYTASAKKSKKQMAKDLKSALKAKRKVANFMEKAEKSGPSAPGRYAMLRDTTNDDDDMSDDVEILENDDDDCILESDPSCNVIDDISLNEISFISNDDIQDSEDEPVSTLPHMREFGPGISYRKLDCNSVLVSIEPFKQLYFAGKAIIQVLKGIVDVYGYRFGNDGNKYTIFSAKGHSSLLCVKALARNGPLDNNVERDNVSSDELEYSQGALIVMEGFENEWCDGMRHTYPTSATAIGPSITGIGPGKLPIMKMFMDKLGFQFIKSSNLDKCKLMEFPDFWEDIFKDVTSRFDCSSGKICPFGGQGVGKSTFIKWLVNRFLSSEPKTEVLFIDLDPGQTQFSPPGMMSVHVCSEPVLGPNFTHLRDPERAIYLGGVNVSDFPVSYIKAVVDLYEFCMSNEKFRGIPWIVNTMGFSQGLGVHLACEIINIIRPTCVIQLSIRNDRRSFPFFLNQENVSSHNTSLKKYLPEKYQRHLEQFNFLSVNSVCNRQQSSNSNSWGANSRTCREMVIASYFAEKIGIAEGFSLRSVVPLKVPLNSIAIGTLNSDLSYNEILDTLNGNLVALCEMSDNLFMEESSQKKFITKASLFTNNCLGYGIVRAMDKKAEVVYIVTPISEDTLLKCNVILSAGAIGLPVHLYVTTAGNSSTSAKVPYVMSRSEGTSTLHTPAKKFFVPRKVTHNALKNCLL